MVFRINILPANKLGVLKRMCVDCISCNKIGNRLHGLGNSICLKSMDLKIVKLNLILSLLVFVKVVAPLLWCTKPTQMMPFYT